MNSRDFVQLYDLDGLSYRDVIDSSVLSLFDLKRVESVRKDLSGVTRIFNRFDFDQVEGSIEYFNDLPGSNAYKVYLPELDESTLVEYRDGWLPPAGFYMKLFSFVTQRPLGIMEINFKGYEGRVNESDNRYIKDHLVFVETWYFIYDFDQNVYLRVDSKSLDKSWNKDFDQIKSERVKIYLQRENFLEQVFNTTKGVVKDSSLALRQLKMRTYEGYDLFSVQDYLLSWLDFFQNVFSDWLKSRLIYSIIDLDEFHLLKNRGDQLLSEVQRGLELINDIQSLTSDIDMTNYHNSSLQHEKSMQIFNDVLKIVVDSVTEKDGITTSGYFVVFDGHKNSVVDNFYEIEKRRAILNDKVDFVVEERRRRELEEKYNE